MFLLGTRQYDAICYRTPQPVHNRLLATFCVLITAKLQSWYSMEPCSTWSMQGSPDPPPLTVLTGRVHMESSSIVESGAVSVLTKDDHELCSLALP